MKKITIGNHAISPLDQPSLKLRRASAHPCSMFASPYIKITGGRHGGRIFE